MKVNLDGMKSFLLTHGEKFGMVIVAGVVVWMIGAGLSTETLDENKSAQLTQAVSSAQRVIDETTEVKLPPPPVVEPMTKIDPSPWMASTELNKPIWPPNTKRADPEIFAARNLEIATGFDPISLVNPNERRGVADNKPNIDDLKESQEEDTEARRASRSRDQGGVQVGPDSNIQGVSWVSVMALVPFEEQRIAYDKAIENSQQYDPGTDYPNYLGYQIERADVTEGGEPNWQSIPGVPGVEVNFVNKLASTYGGQLPPVADPRWTHYILTGQLLPLVGRDFGLEVKHSEIPKMPTPEELQIEQEKLLPNQDEAEEPEDSDEARFGAVAGDGGGRFDGPGRGGARGMGAMGGRGMMRGRGGMGMGEDEGMGAGMARGGIGGRGMGGRGMGGRGIGSGVNLPQADNKKYLMLRFFDVSAQPGRRYQYRVRIVLSDVNYGYPPRMLTREAAEKNAERKSFVFAEWSEPSPIARIPYPGVILAGKATAPSRRANAEPKITMVFKMFDNQEKADAAIEETDLYRGSVGNKLDKIELLDLREGLVKPHENYPLWTGMTLVDICGGRKFPGGSDDFVEPSKALVLTRNGKLVVKSQLEDKPAYESFNTNFKESEEAQMGRQRPGLGGGFEGGGVGDFE